MIAGMGASQALIPSAVVPPLIEVTGHAYWGESFGTLRELAAASSVIVVATVEDPARVVLLNPEDGPNPASPFLTEWNVRIESQIAGPPMQDLVKILQTGGTRNGVTFELTDEVLLQTGSRYIFFLRNINADGTGQTYVATGGPQGQYQITPNGVYSADAFKAEANWLRVRATGEPVDDLIQRIQGALA